jgi:hypothetical protein
MSRTAKTNVASADGTYRYRWFENGLWHSTFFVVQNGEMRAHPHSPCAKFKTFNEFCDARLSRDWKYRWDRCLQVLLEQAAE